MLTRFREALALFRQDATLFGALVALNACAQAVVAMSRDGSEAERAQLRSDLLQAWHEEVTPLDIPGVPNAIEPALDALLETAIASTSAALFDRLMDLHERIDAALRAG